MLLVPANWFIYRKSLSTSISLSFNYLSGDQWRLFSFQAEPMEQEHNKYLIQKKHAVNAWANMEIQQHSHNEYNIIHACKKIQAAISDAKQQVLDLRFLDLSSLPDALFRIPHLKTLVLAYNELTSLFLNPMKNLESLNLAHNKLTSFFLTHQNNIVSLNLKANELTSFSLNGAKKLVSLDLSCNELTSFSLHHAKNLASLDLSCNSLPSFSFNHEKNLASLDLSYNELTSLSLLGMKNLVSLNAEHNKLFSISLNFSYDHVNNPLSLNFAHNQLSSFSTLPIKQKHLVSLNLSYNQLCRFLCHDLPNIRNINLCHNRLATVNPGCMSSLNPNQRITFDLRDNPWSRDAIVQIHESILQRSKNDTVYYPTWFLLIEHIKDNAITHENFSHLLSKNNAFSSSQNFRFFCPITHLNPCRIIFFVTKNKRYIMYDTQALIKWIYTQSHSKEFSEEISDPCTREPLTFKNLMSTTKCRILQYLKQELDSVSTENMHLVHD